MTRRYALLGLARPRTAWFTDVGRWATTAALPADFVKCVSAEDLRLRVVADRRFSAALLDAGMPAVDRDLIDGLRGAGIAPIIVADDHRRSDWVGLGAVAVLPAAPTRAAVLDVLAAHATMVDDLIGPSGPTGPDGALDPTGALVAVTGPGGVGTSTAAMLLAQGLAATAGRRSAAPAPQRSVLLADLCLHAELAMLHDARQRVPGLPEVMDLHRGVAPAPARVRSQAFQVTDRGYALLLGLRRAVDWPTLRPATVSATIAGLRRAWEVVVADIDAAFEGEAETGSTDVEDRNVLARTAAAAADVVVVVGRPGTKWLHGMVRVLEDLDRLGVHPGAIQPVLVDAPRSPRQRAELARALSSLAPTAVRRELATPVHVTARGIEAAVLDAAPLPDGPAATLASAVAAALARVDDCDVLDATVAVPAPVRVQPGELGVAALDALEEGADGDGPRRPPYGLGEEDAA